LASSALASSALASASEAFVLKASASEAFALKASALLPGIVQNINFPYISRIIQLSYF